MSLCLYLKELLHIFLIADFLYRKYFLKNVIVIAIIIVIINYFKTKINFDETVTTNVVVIDKTNGYIYIEGTVVYVLSIINFVIKINYRLLLSLLKKKKKKKRNEQISTGRIYTFFETSFEF